MVSVVTGASGHLGVNLVRALDGPVRALVHRNVEPLAGLGAELVHGSIDDPASLRKAFRGADVVYHLAARISITGDKDGRVRQANVVGARNVAEAARETGARMVHVSSVHAFDLRRARAVDETSARAGPGNYAYDRSKAEGELEVLASVARGLDATIVNPTGVIGPWDHGPSRMGQVFLDLANRKLPAVVTGGFDFVDVRDVAASLAAAAKHGATGENYLLGGHHLTVRDIATLAAEATGVPAPRLTIPAWLTVPAVPLAALLAKRNKTAPKFTMESIGALRHCPVIDHAKAARVLGHDPRPPSDTVRDIYSWFREHDVLV